MDRDLLEAFEQELHYIRELAHEFGERNKKIHLSRDIKQFDISPDPYVERLLEGFAFLTARIHRRMDAEYPQLTQQLLQVAYPQLLAPIPAMAIVQLEPKIDDPSLVEGVTVRRSIVDRKGTGSDNPAVLRSEIPEGEQTPCLFRTAHDVTLWPISIADADYIPSRGDIDRVGEDKVRSLMRITLQSHGVRFDKLKIDRLPIFVRGGDIVANRIHQHLLSSTLLMEVKVSDPSDPSKKVVVERVESPGVRPYGFDDDQALLPRDARQFRGHRVLREYFAFPARFRFVELRDLRSVLARCEGDRVDLVFHLKSRDNNLRDVKRERFKLFCTPVVNLFPHDLPPLQIRKGRTEYPLATARDRRADFEIFDILAVRGQEEGYQQELRFHPLYARHDRLHGAPQSCYFTIRRKRREFARGEEPDPDQDPHHFEASWDSTRTKYPGSDVWIDLLDEDFPPLRASLTQVDVEALCTNRHIPMKLDQVGDTPIDSQQVTTLSLQSGDPVERVIVLAGPTNPRPSVAEGGTAWHLIQHLSLHHRSLQGGDPQQNAAALCDMLLLYGNQREQPVEALTSKAISGHVLTRDGVFLRRGLRVTADLSSEAFRDGAEFLFGAVLEDFLAHHVSLNSFTETVVTMDGEEEVHRWQARDGRRQLI